ncbi:MAG: Arm DNA-binding domain-containing protein, partial [Methylococcaceae bacterium]|nr:Arm DNA-binding domain-containing protein [Methylococcaceae bacterium]
MDNKFNFTKASINAVPTPEPGKRAEYWDAKTPGLLVRVTSTGSRSFYIKRWASNGTERVLIGKYPAVTIEQARKKAAEVNAVIAKGESPAEKKRTDRAEMTFAKFWEEYQAKYSLIRKKPRTIEE